MQESALALTPTPSVRVPELVGVSDSLASVRRQIETAAAFDEPVLILGETGTGKELVARAIHARSDRREAELVVMNCGAVPAELLNSELFGHAAGSFTGADRDRTGMVRAASGSSLLLDEVSETPASFQVALLRAVERREIRPVGNDRTVAVDARFLATSNRSREELASNERGFRADLFHRLGAFIVEIPPLRDRLEDLEPLARHLLERLSRRHGQEKRLDPTCLELLADHPFPGNVRELRQVLFRAYAGNDGSRITPAEIDDVVHAAPSGTAGIAARSPGPRALDDRGLALRPALKRHIERAVMVASFNLSEAARLLEIPRSTLQHYIEKYEVDTEALAAGRT